MTRPGDGSVRINLGNEIGLTVVKLKTATGRLFSTLGIPDGAVPFGISRAAVTVG